MPVSNRSIDEILYDHLPSIYKKLDGEIEPIPFPLKRFLQVASVGLEHLEGEIDNLQLLFQPDIMPEKYLDVIGRMMGFEFPEGTTTSEKRKLIRDLPTMYKLKGNGKVFDMLARLVFHRDAKASSDWRYSKDGGTELLISLEVADGLVNPLDTKMERYLKLAESFRPVNVKIAWLMSVYYQYLVDLVAEENFFEIIRMDDNYSVKDLVGYLNNSLLNSSMILQGDSKLPEEFISEFTTVDLLSILTSDTWDFPKEEYSLLNTLELNGEPVFPNPVEFPEDDLRRLMEYAYCETETTLTDSLNCLVEDEPFITKTSELSTECLVIDDNYPYFSYGTLNDSALNKKLYLDFSKLTGEVVYCSPDYYHEDLLINLN